MAVDKDEIIAGLVQVVLILVEQVAPTEGKIMALGQDILNAIAEESTAVDGIIALLNGLVQTNVIDGATADAIKSAIAKDRDKLNAAILANTPPPPPPPSA
jgi:hypothetical protein